MGHNLELKRGLECWTRVTCNLLLYQKSKIIGLNPFPHQQFVNLDAKWGSFEGFFVGEFWDLEKSQDILAPLLVHRCTDIQF